MANRRMFSRDVVETDRFLGMPLTSQALYFHLGMEADDDGFVPSPRKVQRAVGCTEGDLKHLASCGYIIPFESGVIVIAHWKQSNYVQSDRYKKTLYQEEAAKLLTEKGVYSLDTSCIQGVSIVDTQDRLGKVSLGKVNINTISQTSKSETGIYIPLADGSTYEIPVDKLQIWEKAYPGVDIKQELQKVTAWCYSNPTKRKTHRGVSRFINSWLDRAQNQGVTYRQVQQSPESEAEGTAKQQYATDFTEYLKLQE